MFLVKNDPVVDRLTEYYDLPAVSMGKKGRGILQKYLYQLGFLSKSVRLARKTGAGFGMGVSMTMPMVSRLSKIVSIGLDDDDVSATPVFARYANRADIILTPDALAHEARGPHHLTYPGYHELAYLHPNRFSPDRSVLEELGVDGGEPWFLVRFNDFAAHHDIGQGGMTFEQKKQLVQKLMKHGKVFISTEGEPAPEFRPYMFPLPAEKMHSALALATLYVGESQTMTSEAAVLGTPALKCNSFAHRLSIPNELEEKYGLCYAFLPREFDQMMKKLDELLSIERLKEEWQKRRKKMLEERIDVTAFLAWFIEEFPESVETVKKDRTVFERFGSGAGNRMASPARSAN